MTTILYLHEHGEISGGETSLLLLWQHLDRGSFRPVLLGPESGPFIERARGLGVESRAASFLRFRDLAGRGGWRALGRLVGAARELDPAILHGNTPHTNLAAAWIGRRLGRPCVWHERTLPHAREWDADRWLRALPDRIICNSAAVAERFGPPGPRIAVIRNGVPLDRFRPGCGGEPVRRAWSLAPYQVAAGIVGNFTPWKEHELLLEALALLRPDPARFRLLIVGGEVFPANQGREAALRAQVGRLGLEDLVFFAGTRADMPAVMDALDILVSPAEIEACSRAVLEAMATGIPVVGASAGGTPELVLDGETGLLFPPGDVHGLAGALQRLVEDAPLRRSLGNAARRRAEACFSIQRQARETEAIYRELLEDGAGPRPRGEGEDAAGR